jgi:tetratricopeptide (TPR) repeat protein
MMNISESFQAALEYHQRGDIQQAENIYREILNTEPDNFFALQYLGLIYYQRRNYDVAIEYINKALLVNPTDSHAYYNLGNIYKEKGLINEALESLQKAIDLDPNNVDAYNNKGLIHQEKDQLDEAIICFTKAIKLNPDHMVAYFNLGVVYKNKRLYDEAIQCFQKVLSLNPNIIAAYHHLGIIYQEREQIDEAITNYQRALQLNPTIAQLYSNLGIAFQKQGKLDDAITNYNKAIELAPDLAEPYCNLGNALQEQGRLHDAMTRYQRAIQLNPADASAYYGISQISQSEGQRFAPERSSLIRQWAPHCMGFMVDNDKKVFYLAIHKAGSSSIKHELFFKPLFKDYDYSGVVNEINYILGYNYTTTLEPYKDFFKFAVVRDPYTRFMSAYFMGIHKQYRWKYDFLEKLGIQDWPEEILNDPAEFINTVDKEILNRDPHTALQTYLLPEDLRELDYTGKLENLEEVEEKLSGVLGARVKFLRTQKGRGTDYYSIDIDPHRFNRVFAEDYELLKDFYKPVKK